MHDLLRVANEFKLNEERLWDWVHAPLVSRADSQVITHQSNSPFGSIGCMRQRFYWAQDSNIFRILVPHVYFQKDVCLKRGAISIQMACYIMQGVCLAMSHKECKPLEENQGKSLFKKSRCIGYPGEYRGE